MFDIKFLNEEQLKPAMDTDGAILVTAGAGSGKTRLLTHRICYLIENKKVNPYNILAITFTNKATNEMKERIESMLPGLGHGVWISTYHSMCARILRDNIDNLEGFNRNFTVYDSNDKDKLLKKLFKERSITESELISKIEYHIANIKNLGMELGEYRNLFLYERHIETILEIYMAYQNELKNNNALDFDDLLLKTYELLKNNEMVRNIYQNRFMYIHIDEFQDTNLVQYKITKLLAGKHKNIFVVGDEDQCIYSWRGANIENLISFKKDFMNCRCYKLEQNYRSTKSILKVANALIANNLSRIEKVLWTNNEDGEPVVFHSCMDENAESEYVANKIYQLIQMKNVEPSKIAVLMRLSATSRIVEEKLLNYNIPYKVSGIFKFFERLEIKNIMAYLALCVNDRDNENLKRIINVPKRGIGATSILLLENLAKENQMSMFEVILSYESFNLPKALSEKLFGFKNLLLSLKNESNSKNLLEFVEFAINETGLRNMYNEKTEEDTDRLLNLEQFVESIKAYAQNNEDANLAEYLQSVTIQNNIETMDENNNHVLVSTIHASKGLEFEYVFIIGAEEGMFPMSRAFDDINDMEEERRLMYVAMTRAKKQLIISKANSRFIYGSRKNSVVSRFISESGLKDDSPCFMPSIFGNYQHNSYENYGNKFSYANNKQNDKLNNNTNNFNEKVSENLSTWQKSRIKTQSNDYSEYVEGVQVLHPKFGIGTIVSSEISKENNTVVVNFNNIGTKTLSLTIAPLQILKKKD